MSPKLKPWPGTPQTLSVKCSSSVVRAVVLTPTPSPLWAWNVPYSQQPLCSLNDPLQTGDSKIKILAHVRIWEFSPHSQWHRQMVCHVPAVRATQICLSPVSGTNVPLLIIRECFFGSNTDSLATDGIFFFLLWLPGSSKPCYKLNHNCTGLDLGDDSLSPCLRSFSVCYVWLAVVVRRQSESRGVQRTGSWKPWLLVLCELGMAFSF